MRARWIGSHVIVSLLSVPFLIAGDCEDNPTGTNGGGGSAALTIPGSWARVYRVGSSATTPRAGDPVDVELVVLCGGEPALENLFGEEMADAVCTGSITNSGANITCTLTEPITQNCTRTVVATFVAARDPSTGTISGTQTVTETFEGTCRRQGGDSSTAFVATVLDEEAPGCTPGVADVIPPSWGGTWAFASTELDCETGEPFQSTQMQDILLCPGEPAIWLLEQIGARLPRPDGWRGVPIETVGGFSDTTLDVLFIAIGPFDCPEYITIHFSLTRTDDGFEGTGEQRFYAFDDNSGACMEERNSSCFDLSGTRSSSETSVCSR